MPNAAASFSGSNWLSRGSSTKLNRLTTDPLWVGFWAYVDINTNYGLIDNMRAAQQWYINRDTFTQKATIRAFDSADGLSGTYRAVSAGVINVGQYIRIDAWYDPATKTMYIATNNGAPSTFVFTEGLSGGTAGLIFGSDFDGQNRLAGRLDEVVIAKVIPSSADLAECYNSGAGASWSQLSSALQTKIAAAGSYWSLDDTSWADATGNSNSLTDNNSVTNASGAGSTDPTVSLAFTSANKTSVTFTATASGGTGNLTVDLYRLIEPTSPTGSGTLVATSLGSGTLSYTPPDNRVYHYRARVTDENTPTQGTSVSGTLPASTWEEPLYIVVVGDSISALSGVGVVDYTTASGVAAEMIREFASMIGPCDITLNSQAVAGSYTADFATGGSHRSAYDAALSAAVTSGKRIIVSYMLGVNDAGALRSYITARDNALDTLQAAIDVGATCIVHYPTYSSSPNETTFMRNWQNTIDNEIVNDTTIRAGSRAVYRKTAANWPTIYSDGATHFNATGTTIISRELGSAMANLLRREPTMARVTAGLEISRGDFNSKLGFGPVLFSISDDQSTSVEIQTDGFEYLTIGFVSAGSNCDFFQIMGYPTDESGDENAILIRDTTSIENDADSLVSEIFKPAGTFFQSLEDGVSPGAGFTLKVRGFTSIRIYMADSSLSGNGYYISGKLS
jgi:hypothetical protein